GRERVGLPITVGIATTKFLAKVASAVAKPDGLLLVPPGRELDFLHPLPVERLWSVGPATAARLHAVGITTVAEVAQLDETLLVTLLGRAAGRRLRRGPPGRLAPRRARRTRSSSVRARAALRSSAGGGALRPAAGHGCGR